MRKTGLLRAWGRILAGRSPNLSIEITRECPLRCPGCYAYEPEHLGTAGPLRTLADYSGGELIDRVLDLVHRHDPVHLSIVGGEPLVRFRELQTLLPLLSGMGVSVQLVTSAVRIIPPGWIADLVGGNTLWANFFASVVGAFMYFATLTEVPIIQGLLGSGMGKGPALALLLAGPALSLPNMLVIRGVIGTQKTVVYVALVVVMATISGYLYASLFP